MEPPDRKSTTEQLIALERAGLDRWGQGDPSGFIEICAPEVNYFDPFVASRIDGLEALRAYYASLAGRIRIHRYELLNPSVQVHGETAVLTYNYVSWSSAERSEPDSRWNCSEVYVWVEGRWRLVQTHWSLTEARYAEP